MDFAIGGPSEVSILDRCPNHMTSKRNEVARKLLDKRLMLFFLVQLSPAQAGIDRMLLPISLLVSVALVVLLVLLRANPLSIAAAVD